MGLPDFETNPLACLFTLFLRDFPQQKVNFSQVRSVWPDDPVLPGGAFGFERPHFCWCGGLPTNALFLGCFF